MEISFTDKQPLAIKNWYISYGINIVSEIIDLIIYSYGQQSLPIPVAYPWLHEYQKNFS